MARCDIFFKVVNFILNVTVKCIRSHSSLSKHFYSLHGMGIISVGTEERSLIVQVCEFRAKVAKHPFLYAVMNDIVKKKYARELYHLQTECLKPSSKEE